MALTIPPELKKITPYVRRAEELDRDQGNPESRLVAYYCRQFAVHTGIPLATSPAGKLCLGELLGVLEGEKEAMDSFTRDESKFLCEKFAEKIFDKADTEDRSGEANRNTARTFYAAASFLEILQQFYNDDDDSAEVAEQKKKSVYCKWKSTEILKAIKEGRTPTPGGYGEEETNNADAEEKEEDTPVTIAVEDESPVMPETVEEDSRDDNGDDEDEEEEEIKTNVPVDEDSGDDSGDEVGAQVPLGPPPAYPIGIEPVDLPLPPPAPPVKPPLVFDLPPPAPMSFPSPIVPTPTPKPTPPMEKPKMTTLFGLANKKKPKKKVGRAEIADATELTRFALAALEDKDIEIAAERLEQALQCLGR